MGYKTYRDWPIIMTWLGTCIDLSTSPSTNTGVKGWRAHPRARHLGFIASARARATRCGSPDKYEGNVAPSQKVQPSQLFRQFWSLPSTDSFLTTTKPSLTFVMSFGVQISWTVGKPWTTEGSLSDFRKFTFKIVQLNRSNYLSFKVVQTTKKVHCSMKPIKATTSFDIQVQMIQE